ncbi:MAG: M28 family peptidase [Ignavibacteria bacterium]|nr:M28 family peptidase [Ignavibacteria bacterium]
MKKIFLVVLSFTIALGIISCSTSKVPETESEITAQDAMKHLTYLASDELKGRGTGTDEINIAAEYIADNFKSFGLKPLGDSGYFQNFEVTTGVELTENNSLSLDIGEKKFAFVLNETYSPLGFSANTSVTGEIVFAGYGIEAEKLGYNDFADVDVKDKIALVLRYSPEGDKPRGDFADYSSTRYKASSVRNKGAKGVIFFTGPNTYEDDSFIKLNVEQLGGDAGLPIVSITTKVAEEIFQVAGKDLLALQKEMDSLKAAKSFYFANSNASISVGLEPVKKWTRNVIGLVESENPVYKNEYIVIGAHYDHLGMGGRGSLSSSKEPEIHNGADDNASGTSAVLELAQQFSAKRKLLKRSMVFMTFSGEEMGLLGSAHFVKTPTIPLDKITAMYNLDMVGRLNQENSLTVYGTGTSPAWKDLLNEKNSFYNFKLNFIDDGFGPSDHSSFYSKDIPVLFYFTGTHSDYHKPSDDFDKINHSGLEKISRFVYDMAEAVNQKEDAIAFTKTKSEPRERRPGAATRVYVGTVPDMTTQVEGFKLSGVSDGSPAEKAGLKAGDIIIKFAGKDIKNIYDYMYSMQDHKPGEEVDVVVKRGEEEITLKVTLGLR